MEHLSADQRTAFIEANPDWTIDGETISRTFEFGDFVDAVGFVNKVAMASEVADHHPDIDIRWNKVTLALSTHSESALTTKDTDLATRANGFAG